MDNFLAINFQSVSLDNLIINYMKIPGVSFSLKRALGITKLKRRFTKETGIPTTKSGVEQKVGRAVISILLGKKK